MEPFRSITCVRGPYANLCSFLIFQATLTAPSNSGGGDGGSSTSESSLGSSSGYGSQSTVRMDEQNQQQNSTLHEGNFDRE